MKQVTLTVAVWILLLSCVTEGSKSYNPSSRILYKYTVQKKYPHDPHAFTQGLIYLGGFLYEGTGLEGASTLRKVDLETGYVLQHISLSFFGEGITEWNQTLIQLTWTSRGGVVY